MRRTLPAAVVLFVLMLLAAPLFAAEGQKVKKALFIGIDGTRFDALKVANTPHLDALMKEGIHSDHALILGDRYRKNDTISGPGWSSILTGVWADKHGVQDNSFKGRKYEKYPHFFTLLKSAQPEAKTASFVTWGPIDEFIVSAADKHATFVAPDKTYGSADKLAMAEAVKELASPDLTCLFAYIGNVDETGHAHGFHPTVPKYVAAIEAADRHVGELIAAVKARETFAGEDWLVVVTSDHGGFGRNHGGGHTNPDILHSFLIVSGDSAARGEFADAVYIVDAPVTVLAHLGVKLDDKWELDGKPVGLKGN